MNTAHSLKFFLNQSLVFYESKTGKPSGAESPLTSQSFAQVSTSGWILVESRLVEDRQSLDVLVKELSVMFPSRALMFIMKMRFQNLKLHFHYVFSTQTLLWINIFQECFENAIDIPVLFRSFTQSQLIFSVKVPRLLLNRCFGLESSRKVMESRLDGKSSQSSSIRMQKSFFIFDNSDFPTHEKLGKVPAATPQDSHAREILYKRETRKNVYHFPSIQHIV